MTGQKRELFEAIILDVDDRQGQRGALAFFCVGRRGPKAARHVQSKFKSHPKVARVFNLGYAEAVIAAPNERDQFSSEGWSDESSAKLATDDWFDDNRGAFIEVLNGNLEGRLTRAIIFSWDMDFAARGCVREIYNCLRYFYCDDVLTFFSYSGLKIDNDWLAREVLSMVPCPLLYPDNQFRPDYGFGFIDGLNGFDGIDRLIDAQLAGLPNGPELRQASAISVSKARENSAGAEP